MGLATLRWFVLRPARDPSASARAALLGTAASVVLVIALLGLFATQLLSFNMPPDPLAPDARLLLGLSWGRAWSVQMSLAAASAVAFAFAREGHVSAWVAAGALAVALALTPAFAGHAIATEGARALMVAVDNLHVLAAGTWLGTLGAIAATSSWKGAEAGALLLARIRRFSPLALGSASILAASGAVAAWVHLTRVSDLWTSAYGRWLALKLLLVLGAVSVGFYNWKRATLLLAETQDPASVRASICNELLLAVAIVLVTGFLVATAQPGES